MSSGHDEHHGHHAPTNFWRHYVFSTDHKVIGLQFIFASLLFLILGGLLAMGVRYQLAWPQQNVPYAALLPGVSDQNKTSTNAPKMTLEAPEVNTALWSIGHEVRFNRDVTTAGGAKIPAQTRGTLVSFPKELAVIVPAGTRVADSDGSVRTLTTDVNAFIEKRLVMGDYNYKPPAKARAATGTALTVPATADVPEHQFTLVGTEQYIADPSGVAQPRITTGPVLLPVNAAATPVVVRVAAQKVPAQAAEGLEQASVEAATVESIAGPDGKDTPLTADVVFYYTNRLTTDSYNALFTMHATIMVFFVLMPILMGGFGNFLIPLMIGARDMAFPKLNMMSFWMAMPAGLLILLSFWTTGGSAGGGWTMYPTLSESQFSGQVGASLWLAAIFIVGFSTIVGTLNYITTIINMRAPGMTMFRMPLTIWALFITSILALFATPVLAASGAMLLFDRMIGTHFFMPTAGGQPLLWQHLFWFFGHPEVYILILPSMGMASDILATYARKPIFGYKPMAFAMATIAGLGFIVWGHHMFQSGMNPTLGMTFMASTIMIAVPSAIKTFNWLGTLWGGNIKFTPAMLFGIGFVSMFVIGGLSGIFMASTPVDIQIHDTYFIVAHIHYVLFGGTLFGIFAGIYHWYPKFFGRQMNQRWGVAHFIMTLIAFNGTFFIMHIIGIGGHPRRYFSLMEYPQLRHLQPINVIMTIFALMMGTAQLPFVFNFFASMPRKLSRAVVAAYTVILGGFFVVGLSYWAPQYESLRQFASLPTAPEAAESALRVTGHGVWPLLGRAALWALVGGTIFTIAYGFIWQLGGGLTKQTVRWYQRRVACPASAFVLFMATGVGSLIIGHNFWLPFSGGPKPYVAAADIASGDYDKALAALDEARAAVRSDAKDAKAPNEQEVTLAALPKAAQTLGADTPAAAVARTIAEAQLLKRDWQEYRGLWYRVIFKFLLFSAIAIAAVFGVWWLGARLKVPTFIKIVMYPAFLPIYLSPVIVKPDAYMWLGVPGLHSYWFLILLLLAVPGLAYLVLSRPKDAYGYAVGDNPVEGNSLEWATTSPPPFTNFEVIPVVYRGPYEYSSPVVEEDYLPQSKELPPGVVEPTGH